MKFGYLENIDGVDFTLPPLKNDFQEQQVVSKNQLKLFIGAPVWSDKNYLGRLYPQNTKQKDFLFEYSKQFNSIEVNATRYGTPKPHVIQRWYDSVGPEFKFSLKVPQVITHRKDINDKTSRQRFDEFLLAVDGLKEKSGICFAVMANYFKSDKFDSLVEFIENVPRDLPLAIEFRDHSWFSPTILNQWQELFVKYNISSVTTDTPGRRDAAHCRIIGEHLFVRFVGNISHPSELLRIESWILSFQRGLQLGIKNIWFYVHQPGDKRGKVLRFFNSFISQFNETFHLNYPKLIDYSKK